MCDIGFVYLAMVVYYMRIGRNYGWALRLVMCAVCSALAFYMFFSAGDISSATRFACHVAALVGVVLELWTIVYTRIAPEGSKQGLMFAVATGGEALTIGAILLGSGMLH